MKIKKGDIVKVITGSDSGKQGRVIKVFLDKDRVVVEGVNIVKKHARPTQDNPQGGIIEKEASIHISNLMLVAGDSPTRVGYKTLDDGRKVKIAKSTGEVIN
ncbi:MAG: 50S ribosomal protein L24 [Candidatus Marinimicrobia bacterium]|jgi:large subunit ribosomal protein L24|nr:50S ribosomal protein L24 [Candidatus Neomarinimicrobiota bacterium]MDP6936308.1 50S ribosomal protein L24 [Candidatus Neomarinimicrobiota bacterium]